MAAPSSSPVAFSVVIPTYDRAALAVRAARSALAQTHPAAEVVVVDDGSQDDTADRVADLGDAVRYVRQDNGGVASARNRGVRVARHPWVAFLDSDDVWFPDHLERMATAIEATSGAAGLYFSDTLRSGRLEGRTEWSLSGFTVEGAHRLVDDGGDWVLLPYHPMMTQSVVVSRAAYLEVGGMDERMPVREDTHLWCKLSFGRPVCAVAGLGGHLTDDDDSGGRLTDRRETVGYQETTVLLYEDLLGGGWPRRPEHRAELRRRLGAARWSLGRALLREGKVLGAARHGLHGLATSPGEVVRRIRRNRTPGTLAAGGGASAPT